jgi:hypothetical protein
VDNVQDGVDNCATYYVSEEKLRDLLDRCTKVIEASKLVDAMINNGEMWDAKTKTMTALREKGKVIEDPPVAKELLPTSKGFFFGHYEYDEYYLSDVIETRNWLDNMFAERKMVGKPDFSDIYYHSSW